MRPRIGISCRLQDTGQFTQPIMGVTRSYIDSIIQAGGNPVLIPLTEDTELLRESYDAIDALLIPGGEDVHPRFYNEEPHPKLGKTCEIRDITEIQLIKWAYDDNKPVLGICRGIQVINVALGGTLVQDIGDQAPSEIQHRTPDSKAMWDSGAHEIEIAKDSKLATVIGKARLTVNSLHHQAVKSLAPKLSKTAEADDGTVEAVEAKGRSFFIALQCHPEMLWQRSSDADWITLFKAFVAAARLTN
ncbi:MAG: gamma-glutamyl-gamma-aminobutyrate hydrolase family protein [Deltaproteobacteria bacterium]|nr:gamma-glutamyl-gamma-aminobutyrate hydrolase family protein [Deltaproteobacteria bacterium]